MMESFFYIGCFTSRTLEADCAAVDVGGPVSEEE
jgi:hypothetical protein